MKGPSGRCRFDISRHWRCPQCHRKATTAGTVVFLRCENCQRTTTDQVVWMQIVESPVRPR